MAELTSKSYVTLYYGGLLEKVARFQPFSKETLVLDDKRYPFLDANIYDTNVRQAQYTSYPQTILIRTNPSSSQTSSDSIPGVKADSTELYLASIIQLVKETRGLRGSVMEILHSYENAAGEVVRTRPGIYQIVSAKTKTGLITLKFSSDITPLSPMVPEIRRVS